VVSKLVFADCEQASPNVDIDDAIRKVIKRTKAILVVHYAGAPVDLFAFLELNIPIVEDCAHAIGAIDPVTGDFVGKRGTLATFSFHEPKNIGIGEGGALVVNDPALWERAQVCREKGTNRTAFREGRDAFYTWISLGSSYLLSDVDAGIRWGCLQHYDEIQSQRLSIWEYYNADIWGSTLFEKPSTKVKSNAHMYFLRFLSEDLRTKFEVYMRSCGILVASHYKSLDKSPYIVNQCNSDSYCVVSEQWSNTLVRLPLYYNLDEAQLKKVVGAVNEFIIVSGGMALVPASSDFFEPIRSLRNKVSNGFLNTEEVDCATHQRFMSKHASTYRVAIDSKRMFVGFIGHVDGDLRLATEPSEMRKGVATFMYNVFIREFSGLSVKILKSNVKSRQFFMKLGWKPHNEDNDPQHFVAPKQFVIAEEENCSVVK